MTYVSLSCKVSHANGYVINRQFSFLSLHTAFRRLSFSILFPNEVSRSQLKRIRLTIKTRRVEKLKIYSPRQKKIQSFTFFREKSLSNQSKVKRNEKGSKHLSVKQFFCLDSVIKTKHKAKKVSIVFRSLSFTKDEKNSEEYSDFSCFYVKLKLNKEKDYCPKKESQAGYLERVEIVT